MCSTSVARAAGTEVRDSREQYADLGEHDWAAIVRRVERLAPFPDANVVDDAYEYLVLGRTP